MGAVPLICSPSALRRSGQTFATPRSVICPQRTERNQQRHCPTKDCSGKIATGKRGAASGAGKMSCRKLPAPTAEASAGPGSSLTRSSPSSASRTLDQPSSLPAPHRDQNACRAIKINHLVDSGPHQKAASGRHDKLPATSPRTGQIAQIVPPKMSYHSCGSCRAYPPDNTVTIGRKSPRTASSLPERDRNHPC